MPRCLTKACGQLQVELWQPQMFAVGDSITAVSLGTGTARSSRVVPGLQEAPYIRGSATCLPFVLSKHSSAVFVLEECWPAWMKNKTPSPCLFRVAVIFLYMVQVVGA